MKDKAKTEELINRIDEVLYYLWDPIGVSDEPCARNEYSSYVDSILTFVINEEIDQVGNKLSEIETELMGLSQNTQKNRMIAERLIRDKYAIEEGLK